LEAWERRRTSAQALALRSRIVLAAAAGPNNSEIARALGIAVSSVRKWRNRFAEHRLEGLTDEPRPVQPRKISDAKVEEVIVKTPETTPSDATHWSTRSMAAEVGVNQTAVHRIWKAFGLQPHRAATWELSRDPQFIEKVRDVVGLYLNPPERAVVLCVEEKSQIQALDRTAPILPMLPGVPERATHDYKRSGTSSLYAALDLATGKVIGRLHSRHRAIEFKQFLRTLDHEVPAHLDIHVVLDNSSTQDASDPEMAHRASPVRSALHPNQQLMAEPRRALVRRTDHQETPPRRASHRPRAQRRYPRLDRDLERRPKTLRLDQDRRPEPRIHRRLLHANQRITTLASSTRHRAGPMFRRLLLRQNGSGRLRPRDLRLQPRGLVRRRGPLTRGALPRCRPRQSERRRELRGGRRHRAGSGVRRRSHRTSRPRQRCPAHVARRLSRTTSAADGGRSARRAHGRSDLRRRSVGPAAVRPSRLRGARDWPPHSWRWHGVDLVPAVGVTQGGWDVSAGRLATDLGWIPSCGSSGARPACPLKPAIQWIG